MLKRVKLATTENIMATTVTGERKSLVSMLFFNRTAVPQIITIYLIPKGESMNDDTMVGSWEVPPNDWSEWTADSKLILDDGDRVSVTAKVAGVINGFSNWMVMKNAG